MLTVVTALPWEARALRARLRGRRLTEAGEGWAVWGDHGSVAVRVVVSGPGRERVQVAAAAVAAMQPGATGLLATGVAGGLRPGLRPGYLVLAQRLLDVRTADGRHGQPMRSDPALRAFVTERLASAALTVQDGDNLTVDTAPATPEAKRALQESSGAAVVQMEDYVWAEAARDLEVPFASLRAVLDPAGERLPEAVLGWTWQGPRPREVAGSVVRQPWLPAGLARLAWQRRTAVRSIDRALEAMLAGERTSE